MKVIGVCYESMSNSHIDNAQIAHLNNKNGHQLYEEGDEITTPSTLP